MARYEVKRRSKFGAVRTSCGKHQHASKREAARCSMLQVMLKNGEISHLVQQPMFSIMVNGEHICDYFADFSYFKGEKEIIEDCKGMRTPLYRLKKKLVEAQYNIEILET